MQKDVLSIVIYDRKKKDQLEVKSADYIIDKINKANTKDEHVLEFLNKNISKPMMDYLEYLYGENLRVSTSHPSNDNVEALVAMSLGYLKENNPECKDDVFDIEVPDAQEYKDRIVDFANKFGIHVALPMDYAEKKLKSYKDKVTYRYISMDILEHLMVDDIDWGHSNDIKLEDFEPIKRGNLNEK